VKVAEATYTIPQRASIDPPCQTDACAVGYWPFPAFTTFFEYNGRNNLLLDVDAAPGTNYQITRIFFGPVGFPNRHTFAAYTQNTGTVTEPAVTDMQFTKKRRTTVATSLFYDTSKSNPDYSTPVLLPSTQTGATSAQIEFEGAEGVLSPIPSDPFRMIPDPTTYTGFVGNLDQIDGYRFFRYRITFVANVNTGQVPYLTSLSIPYSY
jgi:hypothetical protein